MISSTFIDLVGHRDALAKAMAKHGLYAAWMEDQVAHAGESITDASLRMVRSASAYILLIGKRYGQIEVDPANPNGWSITRLEFEEAVKRDLPILVFLMDKDHLVHEDHIDFDPELKRKLEEFRQHSREKRIVETFSNLKEFERKAIHAVAQLAHDLEKRTPKPLPIDVEGPRVKSPRRIPKPPELYANPRYPATNAFIGRRDELQTLDEWAHPDDPHRILLFDAIGGSGKSMLTWEWVTNRARKVQDWAGIFWYSFYEEGANLTDFLRHALAYCAQIPLREAQEKPLEEVKADLLSWLDDAPFLFVLDGLERILVAYHRADASKMRDEDATNARDIILDRKPASVIRPSDGEFLRRLTTVTQSKFLVSSRLVPNDLLNHDGQVISGARREILAGLRSDDALALFRASGITGDESVMRSYLIRNCGGHPLVVMALAGAVSSSLSDGDFDGWLRDSEFGQLDFKDLDLVQRRNHILEHAINSLSDKDRELLYLIAILPSAADVEFLKALNPHLPPQTPAPNEVRDPRRLPRWNDLGVEEKNTRIQVWEQNQRAWQHYQESVTAREKSDADKRPPRLLAASLENLARWGLLQRDPVTHLFDLHPVVRGVAVSAMGEDETNRLGRGAVDHFTARAPKVKKSVRSIQELSESIRILRLYLSIQAWESAASFLSDQLNDALLYNLEAYDEYLEFAQAICGVLPTHEWPERDLGADDEYIVSGIVVCLGFVRRDSESAMIRELFIEREIKDENVIGLVDSLLNPNLTTSSFSRSQRLIALGKGLADLTAEPQLQFAAAESNHFLAIRLGEYGKADAYWAAMKKMGFDWPISRYRAGSAEYFRCTRMFYESALVEADLDAGLALATAKGSRSLQRWFLELRAQLALRQGRFLVAKSACEEAIHLARSVRIFDCEAESLILLVEIRLGSISTDSIRSRAQELEASRRLYDIWGAEIWEALGAPQKAVECAIRCYKWAWNDGEPYVDRYHLNRATEILHRLNAPIPDLPPFEPANIKNAPWEDAVEALIANKLKEQEAKRTEAEDTNS